MEELGLLGEKPQDDVPASAAPRPLPGLSFLVPEPEDLEDLYSRYKKLQQELEFLEVQEEYIKDEQRNLKKEFLHAQEEVKRIQSIPLVIGQFLEAVDQNTAIVGSTTGSNYYVRILSTIDRELLKPNASVALHKHSNALVDVLPPEADSSIMMLTSDQKPDVVYADIGGMDIQKQEVREAVELPLTHFELYKQIGIDPPRGVLMYGPPGCGKTMLAKAVAHHTTAAFIRVVGSEFVQKYLGEGPRMVRDVFRLAKENAPAIIFIDEIDAIATKRFDAQTGADREVQRILLELLNQMDGFDQNVNVKVIMATNRADTRAHLGTPGHTQAHLGTPGSEIPGIFRGFKGFYGCEWTQVCPSPVAQVIMATNRADTRAHLGTPGHTWAHLGTPGSEIPGIFRGFLGFYGCGCSQVCLRCVPHLSPR
ncbi:26S proteasome regulatory subunit 6B isoform X1 [Chamaea fasciata]|uniref:26S proteasome regulatory subunit 6B isoform X1 n=1 Tax=Chamaea fasciata TaxID=190680 RepID=UPI00336AABB9